MAALTKPSSPDTPKKTTTTTVAMEAATTTNNDIALASKSAPSESLKSEGAPSSSHAPSSSNTTKSTSNNNTNTMPTYLTTKSSKAYTLSKQLLASGSLDDALSTLEMALQLSRDMLTNAYNNNNDKKDDDDGVNIELHESLAPLYYLYGTTLLYSVEESDVMMANDQTKINGAAAAADIDVPPEDEKVGAEQSVNGGYGEEDDSGEVQEVSDPTEDLQIAWENLDLARSIVTRLVEDFKPNSNTDGAITLKSNNLKSDESDINSLPINNGIVYTRAEQTDLLLDLAQIHTRLGDLQRANANILPCIDDYNLALELRTQTLGKFDKKVADSHFSLAQVYAEAPNQVAENEGKVSDFVNSLGGSGASGGSGGGGGDVELTEEEKIEMRRKSLEHYLACGVAFVGVMAKLCGEDAEVLTSVNDESSTACASDSAAAMASSASSMQTSANYAKTMSTLRQRITSLPQTKLTQDTKLEFDDLKELLDEIQEAMDSAEETEEGLKSLGQMKAYEIKKHEMKQNGESVVEKSEDGAMTTIGFGAPSSSLTGGINAFGSSGAASAATAFGSTTSTTSATAAATMMVVKKKKKKAVVQPVTDGDSTTKRLKTSE